MDLNGDLKIMARPIEATPVFEGEDAEFLLDELSKVHMTDEQRKNRHEACRKRLNELMRPKGFRVTDLIAIQPMPEPSPILFYFDDEKQT